jgi:hypothetical protein
MQSHRPVLYHVPRALSSWQNGTTCRLISERGLRVFFDTNGYKKDMHRILLLLFAMPTKNYLLAYTSHQLEAQATYPQQQRTAQRFLVISGR